MTTIRSDSPGHSSSPSDGESIVDKKMSLFARIGWMVCSMPDLLKNFVWDAFILFYYTQVIGLGGGYVGLALLVILTFDALANPFIGGWSDRLINSKLGRRHTFMLAGILPFALGIYAIFAPPQGLSEFQVFGWLLGFGLLARVGISFWAVPAYALGGDLSRNDKERSIISVLRNVGNQITILLVPYIAFTVFFVPSEEFSNAQLNRAIYPEFGLFAAAIGVTTMVIGFLGTFKRAQAVEKAEVPMLREFQSAPDLIKGYVRSLWETPNVGRIFLAALMILITMSVVNQLSMHLLTYFWQLSQTAMRNLYLAQTVGVMVAMPFAGHFMLKVGRKRAMLVGLLGFLFLIFFMILLPLLKLSPSPDTTAMDIFVVGFRFASGMFYGLYVVPFSATSFDVGDEHRVKMGGQLQQGLVGSLMITGIQFGSAIVGFIVGIFIAIIDFPVGLSVDEIPGGKVNALAIFTMAVIFIFGAINVYIIRGFDISKQKQDKINAELSEKYAKA